MNLPVSVWIGLRYIRARRKNQFISFVSGFSLLGMALGTMALITVLSVMNGFDREIKSRLLRVIPQIEVRLEPDFSDIQALEQLLSQQTNVKSISPYVSSLAMIAYESGLQGVQLRGIDSNHEHQHYSDLSASMIVGDLASLETQKYGIVIGRLAARQLGVAIGDKVSVTLPQLQMTPMGVFPRVKRFTLVGVFEVGAQVDQNAAFISLRSAQKLQRLGDRISGLEVSLHDRFLAPIVSSQLRQMLEEQNIKGLSIVDWTQTQGTLFSAVEMEKTVVTVLLMIIIFIAAFNIIASLVLMVGDKRYDIAVLRTLGLSRTHIMAIFMTQGTAVGAIGIVIGSGLGILFGLYLDAIIGAIEQLTGGHIFDPQVFFVASLPTQLEWPDVILVASTGFVLSILSTLFPAYQASRIEPAEALRYQ